MLSQPEQDVVQAASEAASDAYVAGQGAWSSQTYHTRVTFNSILIASLGKQQRLCTQPS